MTAALEASATATARSCAIRQMSFRLTTRSTADIRESADDGAAPVAARGQAASLPRCTGPVRSGRGDGRRIAEAARWGLGCAAQPGACSPARLVDSIAMRERRGDLAPESGKKLARRFSAAAMSPAQARRAPEFTAGSSQAHRPAPATGGGTGPSRRIHPPNRIVIPTSREPSSTIAMPTTHARRAATRPKA
jgi:hypothetical protein